MSFGSLLNQEVSIYNKASYNRYGKEQVGSATEYKARFQKTSKPTFEYANRGSREVQYIIEGIVYIKPDAVVNEGDKLTYNGINYRVHNIDVTIDATGQTHHKKLKVTKWQI